MGWRAGPPAAALPLGGSGTARPFLAHLAHDRAGPGGYGASAFYHISDITRDPLALLLNLTVTPLVNTETDQVILITVLIGTLASWSREGSARSRRSACSGGTSAAGALGGDLLLHALYPLFPEVHAFAEGGWYRVFNGASAGAFGFMGAYAAMARWPLLWIGLFCVWEPAFWLLVSGDFTSAFHILAFITGFVTVRYFLLDRAPGAGERAPG